LQSKLKYDTVTAKNRPKNLFKTANQKNKFKVKIITITDKFMANPQSNNLYKYTNRILASFDIPLMNPDVCRIVKSSIEEEIEAEKAEDYLIDGI
jgi:hypothetical protein